MQSLAMGQPSNAYRPGVYKVDLRKAGGEVLSLTHRADSDLDAHNQALERAINDGWLRVEGEFSCSFVIHGPFALQ